MKRWLWWVPLVIVISLGIGYVYPGRLGGLPVWLGGEKVIAVRTTRVRKVAGPQRLQLKGVPVPVKQQDIVAPFAGKVIEVRYKSGEAVRAGAIVAIIQSTALTQRGAELDATISAARKDSQTKEDHLQSAETFAAKTRALSEQDLIARRDLDEAQRAVDAARAQRDFARAQLAQQEAMLAQSRTVRGLDRLSAPFGGVISRRMAEPGVTVAESTPIVTVADVAALSLTARVSGVKAGAIRIGQPAEVLNAGPPGNTSLGKIVRIDQLKGDGTPTFEVEIHINPPRNFILGMTLEAAILLQTQSVGLWVPRSSVMSAKGQYYIYRVNGVQAQLRGVTLGMEQGGEVEITTGLEEGEIIVSDPPPNLTSGSRIEPSASLGTQVRPIRLAERSLHEDQQLLSIELNALPPTNEMD